MKLCVAMTNMSIESEMSTFKLTNANNYAYRLIILGIWKEDPIAEEVTRVYLQNRQIQEGRQDKTGLHRNTNYSKAGSGINKTKGLIKSNKK